MKIFLRVVLLAFSLPIHATTPDVGGVKEIVEEASVIAKIKIQTSIKDTQCNPYRHNRYEAKVERFYKMFGMLNETISFCTNADLGEGKQYVVALFCEDARTSGYALSATEDSIFYEGADNKFRRNLPAKLKKLLPTDADPKLEILGFEELLSTISVEKSEISQCHVGPEDGRARNRRAYISYEGVPNSDGLSRSPIPGPWYVERAMIKPIISIEQETKCADVNGKIEQTGLHSYACVYPATDAGKVCTDSSQCQAFCMTSFGTPTGTRTTGKCSTRVNGSPTGNLVQGEHALGDRIVD